VDLDKTKRPKRETLHVQEHKSTSGTAILTRCSNFKCKREREKNIFLDDDDDDDDDEYDDINTMGSDTDELTALIDERDGSDGIPQPKTVEEMYQKKTPREHILLRPDTYGKYPQKESCLVLFQVNDCEAIVSQPTTKQIF